ncbi:MAG: M15 family metallopeptidase [Fidelibacterota bacterium]|nr:MAG: M15 family metallopeptidase [Candidatus Neomarinimicrobiota bacterium]
MGNHLIRGARRAVWLHYLISLAGLLIWINVDAQVGSDVALTRSDLIPIDPKAYLLGQFRPDTTSDFARLPKDLANGRSVYLRTEVAKALERMIRDAREEGVHLEVVSATRSFAQQRAIWNAKFTGERLSGGRNLAKEYPDSLERCLAILKYSSAPGTSRHHWGTDIDFNSTSPAYWRTGEGLLALRWLERHANDYGFFMAYTPDRDRGYRYEPWHWSYQTIARSLLRNHYHQLISPEDINGFHGADIFRRFEWRDWYVDGVSEALR